jgi:hypothetical protein
MYKLICNNREKIPLISPDFEQIAITKQQASNPPLTTLINVVSFIQRPYASVNEPPRTSRKYKIFLYRYLSSQAEHQAKAAGR